MKNIILEEWFWSKESIDSMKDDSYYFLYVNLCIRVQLGIYESKDEAIRHYIDKFYIDVDIINQKLSFSNKKSYPVTFAYNDRLIEDKEFWRLAKEKTRKERVIFVTGGATSYEV